MTEVPPVSLANAWEPEVPKVDDPVVVPKPGVEDGFWPKPPPDPNPEPGFIVLLVFPMP